MKKRDKSWLAWLYAAVLAIIAIAGVFYASSLKENADPTAPTQEYYAVDEKTPIADSDIILDLGDIDAAVPLGDASGEE